MQPNTAGNPASAQPMRGLSKRAQKLLGPKRYAHMVCRTNPKLRHKLAATSADARIMRGLAGALQDLANHPAQLELHRPAIQSGLAAIERVLPDLEPLAIGVGMVKCKAAIAHTGISAADIQQMLGAPIDERKAA